jgi:hypothetical protein
MERQHGSVFEAGSRASHEALVDLREILEHLGFWVVKKIDKEDTLRAYPERLHSYPLLNPRFVRRTVRGLSGRFFLEIRAWSKGNERLGQHLRSYRSMTESKYIPARDDSNALTRDSNTLVLHGSFYIRVHLCEDAQSSPDLNALGVVLKDIRDFLQVAA